MNDLYIAINIEYCKTLVNLSERVQKSFMKTITALSEDILRFVEKCESPIEQLFAIWLFQYYYFQWAHIDGCKETMLNISVQKEITCEDCSYRVDFYLEFTRKGVCQKVIIECDGHEFHEKTKEQAANDKRRDRDLVKNGYTILRFTGSEIYKDASKCVGEVFILFTRKKSE